MTALIWCGIALAIGILMLIFGSPQQQFAALFVIPIAVLAAVPFGVAGALAHKGSGLGHRMIKIAGFAGLGCLIILFGGSLLIFAGILIGLAWQRAARGDYIAPIVAAAVFAPIALLMFWVVRRARRT